MKLFDLINNHEIQEEQKSQEVFDCISNPEIRSISHRADKVTPGGLFIAVSGFLSDGHDFIDQAIENGAAAIITEKEIKQNIPFVKVNNTRKALSYISAAFFCHPSEKLAVFGITGTNGKTTITYIIEHILEKADKSTGVIGTVNCRYMGEAVSAKMTTPDALSVQNSMNKMVSKGVECLIMEVSSHAIDLHRVDDINFDICVFTNLSLDHLDYHKTMESYWKCKQKLFTDTLLSSKKKSTAAVINCNDPRGKELFKTLKSCRTDKNTVLAVADKSFGGVWAEQLSLGINGIAGKIFFHKKGYEFTSSLAGTSYNLENILCAAGACYGLGISEDIIILGLKDCLPVPGRLETIKNSLNRHVFVDYAHTPDALFKVLKSLKNLTRGRIICIFGCGGDRDKTKRPVMGKIAAEFSDVCIVTSDNPRSEDPGVIIDNIIEGINSFKADSDGFCNIDVVIETDRRAAIYKGITSSVPGDTILIAGKGHEDYQIIGTQKKRFCDRTEAIKAFEELKTLKSV